jgi:uncharacterized protein YcbX
MERRQIGVVQDLFRYPVKSMRGERLREVDIGAHGVIGDRAYALHEANGRVVTGKKWSNMLGFSARYDAPPVPGALASLHITLPDGRTIQAQAPDVSAVLSTVLGRPVTLECAQGDQHSHAEIDPATLFADVGIENVLPKDLAATITESSAIPLPPGTFFDSGSIHVLASGTLAHLRTLVDPDVQIDPRRFRPNIMVETTPEMEGFVEDEWLEGTLEVGESVTIVQMRPTIRCAMTTHQQSGLRRDLRILRTIAHQHRDHLGVWAAIGTAGTVRVGDPVVLVK